MLLASTVQQVIQLYACIYVYILSHILHYGLS